VTQPIADVIRGLLEEERELRHSLEEQMRVTGRLRERHAEVKAKLNAVRDLAGRQRMPRLGPANPSRRARGGPKAGSK